MLLAAAGTATVTMEIKGRASHAGAAPQLGRNALVELAHQVVQTQDVAKGIPGAQLNWPTMQSGKTRNPIPDPRHRHRQRQRRRAADSRRRR